MEVKEAKESNLSTTDQLKTESVGPQMGLVMPKSEIEDVKKDLQKVKPNQKEEILPPSLAYLLTPNFFEIQNHINLRLREHFKIESHKHLEMFAAINIFSAFKSKDDYMIVEYGLGYAIVVDGVLRRHDRDSSKC